MINELILDEECASAKSATETNEEEVERIKQQLNNNNNNNGSSKEIAKHTNNTHALGILAF